MSVSTGSLKYAELLSSDLHKNILAALIRLGAVSRLKGYVRVRLGEGRESLTERRRSESALKGKVVDVVERGGGVARLSQHAVMFAPQGGADDSEGGRGAAELPGRLPG